MSPEEGQFAFPVDAASGPPPIGSRSRFLIFSDLLEGKSFLDLFAGCGNVGLEALSRGARGSVFVEKDLRLVEAIRDKPPFAGI